MKFSSDHYFHIGHEHVVAGRPCQDHALSFASSDAAVAVISDGCSDGKETDMGARLITFSTVSATRTCGKDDTPAGLLSLCIRENTKRIREEGARALSLARADLLATELYAYMTPLFGYAFMRGDGVIAWKDRVGKVTMARYDWAHNTPCYPAYEADNFTSFIEVQGKEDEQGLTEVVYEWTNEDGFKLLSETTLSIKEAVHGVQHDWSKEEIHELSLISVMSDGVTRVDDVDWKEVVLQVLALKNTNGEFLKRRLIRMNKDWSKSGIKPLDDIACSTIYINHEGEDDDSP